MQQSFVTNCTTGTGLRHFAIRWSLLLLIVWSSSCVPYKKMIYLQNAGAATTYSPQNESYRLSPGDVLLIQISSTLPTKSDFSSEGTSAVPLSVPDPLLRGYTISDSGNIYLPVIGSVEVVGLTVEQVIDKLNRTSAEYISNPSIKVNLVSFNVTLIGEFMRPGRYFVYNPKVNLLEALALGGDLSPTADRTRIKLVRREGNQLKPHIINLTDEKLLSSPLFYLRPGDIIYAEPVKAKNVQVNNATILGLVGSFTSLMVVVLNILVINRNK